MRISTSMIYEKGVFAMQQQTAGLLKTQQQVSTGRRILTPADDPIASARSLELSQSKAVNQQFALNIGYADDNLKLLENKLVGVGDIFQYARERAVQAGNSTLGAEDLGYIATDLRSQFEGLLGIANSRDGQGDYMFSGYKSNTKPFEGGLSGVSYEGDQGGRTIQVSASRFMPTSLPGSEVFAKTLPVDDSLVNAFTGRRADGSENLGDGVMAGTLATGFPTSEADLDLLGRRIEVVYREGPPEAFDVYEHLPGVPERQTVAEGLADLSSLADNSSPNYRGIVLAFDGAPADGDRFEVFVSSNNAFDNLAVFIDALERPGASRMNGAVAFALESIDGALENVLRVRAQIGSQMVEAQQLSEVGSDLDVQYSEAISKLEDVDYAEAISRFTQQQTYLQAAQQSFMRVTNLSLFNFLN